MNANTVILRRIASNCTTLGHYSHTAAMALYVLGRKGHALCPWCIEADRSLDDAEIAGLPKGGDCDRCAYSGVDVCVVDAGPRN